MKTRGLLFLVCSFSFLSLPASADSASTNYALVEDQFTGGGGSASSANYQVAETSFASFAGEAMSSTNYGLASKVGIAGAAPIAAINSVSPANFSKHYSDENASFTVTAVDPDSDSLQYQATQDSTTKVPAQSSNVLSWALGSLDIGRRLIQLHVIDPDGTVVTRQSAYVYRRPVK